MTLKRKLQNFYYKSRYLFRCFIVRIHGIDYVAELNGFMAIWSHKYDANTLIIPEAELMTANGIFVRAFYQSKSYGTIRMYRKMLIMHYENLIKQAKGRDTSVYEDEIYRHSMRELIEGMMENFDKRKNA